MMNSPNLAILERSESVTCTNHVARGDRSNVVLLPTCAATKPLDGSRDARVGLVGNSFASGAVCGAVAPGRRLLSDVFSRRASSVWSVSPTFRPMVVQRAPGALDIALLVGVVVFLLVLLGDLLTG